MPGGIGNHAHSLATEFRDSDFNVTVLTEHRQQSEGDWHEFAKDNQGINLIGIRRNFLVVFTYLARVIYSYRLVCLSHYHAVIFSGRFSVWLNGILPGTKSIIVVHGGELKQRAVAKLLFYNGLKRAKYIVCVSSFTRDQLLSHYKKLDASKIVVINNGIKNDWLLEKGNRKIPDLEKLNLITVGGIHRRKGQWNVIRVLPSILRCFPDTLYSVVGLPLEKDDLVAEIAANSLTEHVVFYHAMNDREVKDLVKTSHIFLMLSDYLANGDFEGFGIAAMEAMALGVPAIGTRNSGIADAIKDGYSGKLVDAKNTVEIANAVTEIMANYQFYSKNAKVWATGFQWRHKIREYRAVIEKMHAGDTKGSI